MTTERKEFGDKATANKTYYNVEIYTKNPETGEDGWDIEFVDVHASSKKEMKQILTTEHPHFDCIIDWDSN
jgi:hypothetical protein